MMELGQHLGLAEQVWVLESLLVAHLAARLEALVGAAQELPQRHQPQVPVRVGMAGAVEQVELAPVVLVAQRQQGQ